MAKKIAPPVVKEGDHVLIGSLSYTMPSDWFFATVKWCDGRDVLVEQYGLSGHDRYVMVHSAEDIRAVGDFEFLRTYQSSTAAVVRSETDKVKAAEQALNDARRAVWSRLEEIGRSVGRQPAEPA